MPGTDGQPRWLSHDEQQAWRATIRLSQLLLRQLEEIRDAFAPIVEYLRKIRDRD